MRNLRAFGEVNECSSSAVPESIQAFVTGFVAEHFPQEALLSLAISCAVLAV